MIARSLEERFWEKVDKNGPVIRPELGPCWVWTAAIFVASGYGCIGDGPTCRGAHRVSFELNVRPIRPGFHICHHCDVRRCVRPDHIFEGTMSDNMRDMVAKGRRPDNSGERHPSAKLTDAQVLEMCLAHAAGATQRDLADQYGVTQPTVSKLVRGRRRGIHAEARS